MRVPRERSHSQTDIQCRNIFEPHNLMLAFNLPVKHVSASLDREAEVTHYDVAFRCSNGS